MRMEREEPIARFCDRSTRLVSAKGAARGGLLRSGVLYHRQLQVLVDADEINAIFRPDVIVLDEAQRIKNWQTKTARRVKSLRSPYAFVLTGTPPKKPHRRSLFDRRVSRSQNRRPAVSLRSRPPAVRRTGPAGRLPDLGDLRARLQPLLLRRRKSDVESELPGRTVKTYFVPMTGEQQLRYEDYHFPARQLIAKSQRRPLTEAEFKRLQILLGCMRMLRYAGDSRPGLPRQPQARIAGAE
jgi:SNF2 family DNA or RNA helicase